MKKNVSKFYLS